jgi:hypothetical protein
MSNEDNNVAILTNSIDKTKLNGKVLIIRVLETKGNLNCFLVHNADIQIHKRALCNATNGIEGLTKKARRKDIQ